MTRPWRLVAPAAMACGAFGWFHAVRNPVPAKVDPAVVPAAHQSGAATDAPVPAIDGSEPVSHPTELTEPQPVDVFIRRALAENRTVQAAYHNVLSLTELEIFPISHRHTRAG